MCSGYLQEAKTDLPRPPFSMRPFASFPFFHGSNKQNKHQHQCGGLFSLFLFLGHFDCYALIQHGYFTQRNCCNKQYTSVRPLVYEAEINLLKTVLTIYGNTVSASPKFTKWPVFQMSRPPFPTLTKPCVVYFQPYQSSKVILKLGNHRFLLYLC